MSTYYQIIKTIIIDIASIGYAMTKVITGFSTIDDKTTSSLCFNSGKFYRTTGGFTKDDISTT